MALSFCLERLCVLMVAGLAFGCVSAVTAGPIQKPAIAVVGFDYSDSSGEPADQSAAHDARVAGFRTRLRDRLAGSQSFDTVELPCADKGCSAATTPPEALLAEAKAAGADLLVFGGIHKMSTLVGWGRIDVIDVASGKLVFDRVLSFRGDSDEAFERAADFVARDITRTLAPMSAAEAEPARGIR